MSAPAARVRGWSLTVALLGVLLASLTATDAHAGTWTAQTKAVTAVIIYGNSCPTATDCVQVTVGGRVQYTSNGGTNWTLSPQTLGGSIYGLDCPSVTTCFAVAGDGRTYKSTDHGASWTTVHDDNALFLTEIDCPSTEVCYSGSSVRKFRWTTDGGATWTDSADQTTSSYIAGIDCPTTTVCYAVMSPGEIRKKQAGSDTWDLMATSAAMPDVYPQPAHPITCPSLTVCYVAATTGEIRKSSDGGATWPAQTTGTAPDTYAISCVTTNRCLSVGVANKSQFTDDGGALWTEENTGSAAAMYVLDFPTMTTAFAGDAIGVPYKYTAPPGCSSGSLSMTAPLGAVTFPAVSLGGSLTSTATGALTVDDQSAAQAGWSLSATSTTFTSGGNTLPTTATTITGVSATPQGGACVAPSNTMSYPITLPAAGVAPTAAKFFSTPDDTGTGPVDLTPAFSLAVPANARTGTYTSTWTVTIASGP